MSPSLMLVLAHPDDETMGPGGTIARYARQGVRVSVITATSGQAGQTGGLASTPEQLGRVREEEARAAAKLLGVSTIHLLGYIDGKLEQVDDSELEEKVVSFIRRERPDVLITFGPEGAGNEHPDHRAISRIATRAFCHAGSADHYSEQLEGGLKTHFVKKMYYMSGFGVSWRKMSAPFQPVTTIIDISDLVDLKIAAFKLHRTQQKWLPRLVDWIHANQNTEPYHRAASMVSGLPESESDLFCGLD